MTLPLADGSVPLPIALYPRISQEERDAEKSIETAIEAQLRRMHAWCEEQGIPTDQRIEFRADEGISASEYAREEREDWPRVMAALDSGAVKSILAIHQDRMIRKLDEADQFRRVIRRRNSGHHTLDGYLDLTTDGGVVMFLNTAMHGLMESMGISRRVGVKRTAQRETHGIYVSTYKPFGYTNNRWTEHQPSEAFIFLRAVEIFLSPAGNWTKVMEYMHEADARNYAGNLYTRRGVHDMLLNAAYAGYVIHGKGKERHIVRESVNIAPLITKVTHEAIVTKAEALRTGVNSNQKGGLSTQARKHLLSGFVVCGGCGARMAAQFTASRERWGCPHPTLGGCGKSSRNHKLVWAVTDAYVRAALVKLGELTPADPSDPARAALAADLAAAEDRVTALRTAYADGHVKDVDFYPTLADLRASITRLTNTLAAKESEARAALPPDRLATWDDTRPEAFTARRAILSAVVSQIVVVPVGRGPAAGPESVKIIPAA